MVRTIMHSHLLDLNHRFQNGSLCITVSPSRFADGTEAAGADFVS